MTPLAYLEGKQDEILRRLIAFASIPSVSTDPAYKDGIARASAWVAEQLTAAGMQNVRINPTAGHPIVTADWLGAPGKPTVFLYAHHDVQPVNFGGWNSDPWTLTARDGRLFGRGAADDKGAITAQLGALAACLRTSGKLPVNVKMLVEGEEEVGSQNLLGFFQEHKNLLMST